MGKKGNLCPECGTELNESTDPTILKTYLAGRDLSSEVRCPECGHRITISAGPIQALFSHQNMEDTDE